MVHNVGLCIALWDIENIERSFIYPGDGATHTIGELIKVKYCNVIWERLLELDVGMSIVNKKREYSKFENSVLVCICLSLPLSLCVLLNYSYMPLLHNNSQTHNTKTHFRQLETIVFCFSHQFISGTLCFVQSLMKSWSVKSKVAAKKVSMVSEKNNNFLYSCQLS